MDRRPVVRALRLRAHGKAGRRRRPPRLGARLAHGLRPQLPSLAAHGCLIGSAVRTRCPGRAGPRSGRRGRCAAVLAARHNGQGNQKRGAAAQTTGLMHRRPQRKPRAFRRSSTTWANPITFASFARSPRSAPSPASSPGRLTEACPRGTGWFPSTCGSPSARP